MIRFALYARTSTEDLQSPEESKRWQESRAKQLIAGHGEIVTTYHDIGQSRSLPWKRRPEAATLLQDLRNPDRGFSAVVVAEPQRAFSGNQFDLIFPLFVHHGVDLWVPDIGGRIDPGSDGHEMMMSFYGTLSKQERRRIQKRVKNAVDAISVTNHPRHLGGRAPYGYKLVAAEAHPNPAKAKMGLTLTRLDIDPLVSEYVPLIFTWRLEGFGLRAIAARLTEIGAPTPSAHDPERNRHRRSNPAIWQQSAVRAILTNATYLGKRVRNRQRREEVLIDINNVSDGYKTVLKWNDPSEWLWSSEDTHPALVTPEVFDQVQASFMPQEERQKERANRAPLGQVLHPLRGLVICSYPACGRRMEISRVNGHLYLRCKADPARKAEGHPATSYLRPDQVLPAVCGTLAQYFAPENLQDTAEALAAAANDSGAQRKLETAERRLAEANTKLLRFRAAIESGADPVAIASWINEAQKQREAAEAEINFLASERPPTASEIREQLEALGDVAETLREEATPEELNALLDALGVRLSYAPGTREVIMGLRVGGGSRSSSITVPVAF